jgi:hypothetical protein
MPLIYKVFHDGLGFPLSAAWRCAMFPNGYLGATVPEMGIPASVFANGRLARWPSGARCS